MTLRLFSFLFGLLFVPGVFIFRRTALNEKNARRIIFVICTISALLGLYSISLNGIYSNSYILLFSPIFSFSLFQALFYWFLKKVGRQPKETHMKWYTDENLWWDRAFNLAFLICSLVTPLFVAHLFMT